MLELYEAAVELINLPLTVLLGLVIVYWLLLILGVVGLDTFDSFFEFELESDVQVDAEVDAQTDTSFSSQPQASSFLQSFLHFLNVGDVPLMAVWSVLILCLWSGSILANHYWNPDYSIGRGLLLLLPNLLLGLILTHFLTRPLRPIFRRLNQDDAEKIELIGQTAKVTTGEVTDAFGQATVDHAGVPITVQVRAARAQVFKRGDTVLIVAEDETRHTYKVVQYEMPS